METPRPSGRRPRADALRNRATLIATAQKHFLEYGVGTSLEAVAKDARVGPGTLYRHFPTREALLAAVLQDRAEELLARRATIGRVDEPGEALRQWFWAMREYFSSFTGLPEPLIAAAQARDPDNPLTVPCTVLIEATDGYVEAARRSGCVRPGVSGHDLFLASVSLAWTATAASLDTEAVQRLHDLIENGYRAAAE